MSISALLLATALLVAPGASGARSRAGLARASRHARPAMGRPRVIDPVAVASSLDVFAVCLSAGMAVSAAASATAGSAPQPLSGLLRRAADLLALGADPAVAWAEPDAGIDAPTRSLLRLARRSASSGAALAAAAADLAVQARHSASAAATAAAERAGVLIAGPLGLCFLPAFVCLGIVPVVAGLAGGVLNSGLL
jgi:pilus assembly protein TadC